MLGGKKGRKEINRLEWGMQIMEISTMGSHQLVNRKEKKISDGIQGLNHVIQSLCDTPLDNYNRCYL